jgi:uncharacterized membrane protein YagU involved in acid resistance
MTTVTALPLKTRTESIKRGALAGIAGGIVLGMMMAMMGSLTMIASMVGSSSAAVGFIVHIMISAAFGMVFGLIGFKTAASKTQTLIRGSIYGIILWVAGPLVMMPLMMGMSNMVFSIGGAQLLSLMGHVIYGLVTAYIFAAITK